MPFFGVGLRHLTLRQDTHHHIVIRKLPAGARQRGIQHKECRASCANPGAMNLPRKSWRRPACTTQSRTPASSSLLWPSRDNTTTTLSPQRHIMWPKYLEAGASGEVDSDNDTVGLSLINDPLLPAACPRAGEDLYSEPHIPNSDPGQPPPSSNSPLVPAWARVPDRRTRRPSPSGPLGPRLRKFRKDCNRERCILP